MSRRLEELERGRVKLEALVRAIVAVDGDSSALSALQATDITATRLLDHATRALARVYAEIEALKLVAEKEPS